MDRDFERPGRRGVGRAPEHHGADDDRHGYAERFDRDPHYARSFASGAEPYPGEAQSQSSYALGRHGRDADARDYGRGQHESGGYDPYRRRGRGYGSGYGGYGDSPGEAAGGFDSGRSYAAEPGWGPGYGAHGRPGRRTWRGPKGYQRSDERLKEDVCERLMWRGDEIDASEVSVEVNEGVVTLHGAVPERSMKHAIEDIVADCMGVKDIENRIRVTYGEHHEVRADQHPRPPATAVSIGGSAGTAPVSGMGDAAPGASDD